MSADGSSTRALRVRWPVAIALAAALLVLGAGIGFVVRGDGNGGGADDGLAGAAPTAARPEVLAPSTTAGTAAGAAGSGSGGSTAGPPAGPDEIDARICGSERLNEGPASAEAAQALYPGRTVVTLPPGDNAATIAAAAPGTVFWMAPGAHTLGPGEFGQILPKQGDVYIGAPGAVLDGQRQNRYAFGGRVDDVTIRYLTVTGFVAPLNEGVVNHDSGNGWVIEHTTIRDNEGAGMMAGARQQVRYTCLADNGQYGFNAYQGGDGITDVVFEHNEITGNNTGDWEAKQKGCGCTGGGKFWSVRGARVVNNWVHGNKSVGLWADTNNVDFLFERNIVEENDGVGIWYEISYNARIADNLIVRNGWAQGAIDQGAPAPGVYLSEAGGDARLPSALAGAPLITVTGNRFTDNYSGITLYENANRFCNSNGNSSTGYCTPFVTGGVIAEPHDYTYGEPVSDAHPCYAPGIGTEPLFTDCRWRTQLVRITGNEFAFDESVVPCASDYCGVMALYVSGADNQDWQPYVVADVMRAVTRGQDNRWLDNRYSGPWRFAVEYGDRTDWDTWRSDLGQDEGSTFAG